MRAYIFCTIAGLIAGIGLGLHICEWMVQRMIKQGRLPRFLEDLGIKIPKKNREVK